MTRGVWTVSMRSAAQALAVSFSHFWLIGLKRSSPGMWLKTRRSQSSLAVSLAGVASARVTWSAVKVRNRRTCVPRVIWSIASSRSEVTCWARMMFTAAWTSAGLVRRPVSAARCSP